MPSNSTDPLVTALDKMINDLQTRDTDNKYAEAGVRVADFTKDPKAPRIWLHNADTPRRVASTGKVTFEP
jgi:hypothetical protein